MKTTASVDTAEQVKWIHAHSGLSWKELARMFGTSKNQVHMWTNGSRVHASQAARLMQLEDIIRDLELDALSTRMVDPDLPDRLYDIEMAHSYASGCSPNAPTPSTAPASSTSGAATGAQAPHGEPRSRPSISSTPSGNPAHHPVQRTQHRDQRPRRSGQTQSVHPIRSVVIERPSAVLRDATRCHQASREHLSRTPWLRRSQSPTERPRARRLPLRTSP